MIGSKTHNQLDSEPSFAILETPPIVKIFKTDEATETVSIKLKDTRTIIVNRMCTKSIS